MDKKDKKSLKGMISDIIKPNKEDLGEFPLSKNIDENMQEIKNAFNNCCDLSFREFTINGGKTRCFIAYIEGTVKLDLINDNILKPLMSWQVKSITESLFNIDWIIENINKSTAPICEVSEVKNISEITDGLLGGCCVLFVDQNAVGLSLNVEGWEQRKTGEAEVEPVLRGAKESFVESITLNTALLRKRIKTPNLKLEKMEIGRISKTSVIIAYISGIAEDGLIKEIRSRLKRIDIDIVMESGILEHFVSDSTQTPFPVIEVSERPDLSTLALSEGRVVIIVDGTPFVLIAPAVFADFFVSVEDNYTPTYFTVLIILLRYVAFFIALLAPSFFIAVTTYHQEMIPYQLLSTFISARVDLPFPVFLEALLMEITFELLREAGERMPRAISPSVSIVGTLVLGQAAIQSGLVSPIMVVIIAITATASFVNTKLSRSIRALKLPFMILAASLGLFGIVMGGLVLMILMVSSRSFGVPYMSPFTPSKGEDLKTLVFRFPLWFSNKRPTSIQKNNIIRANENGEPKTPQSNE